MLLTLTVGTAGADPVTPPTKVVQAGMRLKFDTEFGQAGTCTLGAVGTDARGKNVGITAGHCNPGAERRTPILNNNYPVWDWRDVTTDDNSAAPIGWVRYVSGDNSDGFQWLINNIDYMVIEFADNVQPSSTVMTVPKYGNKPDGTPYDPVHDYAPGTVATPSVPWFKMNVVYTNSSGNPTVPAMLVTNVCHAGAITTQQNAQADKPYDARCGTIIYNQNQDMYTNGYLQEGDSGGPVWVKDQTAKWVGIVARYQDGFPYTYYVHTSAKKILDDMNSKPVGYPGKGFQITNN